MTEEDNVFSRWSRRKRRAVSEEATDLGPESQPQAEMVPDVAEEVEPETDEDEAALLHRLGLPKPESLGEGDDFAPFMKAGVPQFLRKRALKVLWRSNPVLANLDGLNDYDDDFNAPELTQKVLATGYQVGRGFLKKVGEALEEDEPEAAPVDKDQPVDNHVAELDSKPLEHPPMPVHKAEPDGEPDMEVVARPRRMRFRT